ncbi:glutaredoxin family protein [Herbiconiux sp. L3-i23]|uniref:glutaredoxin family protein n=1 Tax=Herbiconiux sp. L3-i23 TaxID=2905871 RepID=UPI00206CF8E3|nr:glutaredoxin family protein [Herbiconiux sp. L3-i23]BDI21339.1 hypothetical protein L3i23_01150 [Herbiconiux sp. L3-i23]
MSATSLSLYGKPGCHLCEVAKEIVDTVVAEFPEGAVDLEEIDILQDPELVEKYGERIPVLLIDAELHAFWRVDSGRLRRALDAAVTVPN